MEPIVQTAGTYKLPFMQFTISWNLDPRQYGQVRTPKLSENCETLVQVRFAE